VTNFGTHFGQSESVERGQPRRRLGLFVGLEQRLATTLGLGRRIGLDAIHAIAKTAQTPLAPMVTAFSTYLIGLCIVSSVLSGWWQLLVSGVGQGSTAGRRFADG